MKKRIEPAHRIRLVVRPAPRPGREVRILRTDTRPRRIDIMGAKGGNLTRKDLHRNLFHVALLILAIRRLFPFCEAPPLGLSAVTAEEEAKGNVARWHEATPQALVDRLAARREKVRCGMPVG